MGSKIDTQSDEAEKAVRDIRRATRRHFSAEDKVRIVRGLFGKYCGSEVKLEGEEHLILREDDILGVLEG
jgi:co-chaperonin GroES (HSP10)